MKIHSVAVLGAGAVGSYVIWGLSEKKDISLSVIAKGERAERLKAEGQAIGRAEGRAEMQQNIVIKLLSANQFSDKEICSIVDISEEKLEEYKKMYSDTLALMK